MSTLSLSNLGQYLVWGLPWWSSGEDPALPMRGTQVWSLAKEDPTCLRAAKPMCHNYWACVLQLRLKALELCYATRETTAMRSLWTATRESPHAAVKTPQPKISKSLIKKIPTVGLHTLPLYVCTYLLIIFFWNFFCCKI